MATREKDGQNQSESTSRDMWKHGMEAGLAYARLGRRSRPGCHSPLQRNGSWGSYQRGDALCGCAGLPYFPCPWPCQSAGDQISKLIALLGKVFSSLPECVIVCSCVFAPQDAGVLEASEAMRGHHPESCPRRALQQGELWVDTSRASGQCVTARVRGFRRLNFRFAPLVLIFEMLKKAI